MADQPQQIPAKIIRRIAVKHTDKSDLAVLELQTSKGSEHYVITGEAMTAIGNHLLKLAPRFQKAPPPELQN